jgi:ABC-type multidrug transport system fused ATPase/permease subunit
MQQSVIAIKSFSASSVDSLNYVLPKIDLMPKNICHPQKVFDSPSIEDIVVDRVSFGYPDSEKNVLKDLSIKLTKGQICAIVGPSGSGKSTFCDLLLGLLKPKTGTITISGVQLCEFTHVNPELIAYLPQDVFLIEGSIAENILLGRERNEHTEEQLRDSVKIAGIIEFIDSLPNGMDTQIGGKELALSGGQKQRIGLARTLFSKPSVLIMDEPTSSLDAASENIITETLNFIKKDVIIVIVAHRLSTIRDVDRIIYLKDGVILGDGNFAMLKKNLIHFEKDAQFQGL